MKLKIFIGIFWIIISAGKLFSQNGPSIIQREKDFCFSDSTEKHIKVLELSNAYKLHSDYLHVIKTLENFMECEYPTPDSSLSKIYYELQLSYYLTGDIIASSSCYNKLRSLKDPDSLCLQYSDIVDLYLLNSLHAWDAFYKKYEALYGINISDSIFSEIRIREKFLKKAGYLAFIPGMGQIKLGYHKRGWFAFLMDISLMTCTSYLYYRELYYLAGLVLTPVILRLYIGNHKFTHKLIDHEKEKFNKEIEMYNRDLLNKLYLNNGIKMDIKR